MNYRNLLNLHHDQDDDNSAIYINFVKHSVKRMSLIKIRMKIQFNSIPFEYVDFNICMNKS
jgi:hypothetical protein